MEELLRQRLELLRRRGNPGVAPLWAERLSPEEFLALGFALSAPWVALMTARALAATGRPDRAKETLSAMEASGAGIEKLRRELESSLEISGATGEARTALLEGWLNNVLLWRARSASAPDSVEAPA